jgi:hypothetical protein
VLFWEQNFNNTVKWLENSIDIYIDSSFTCSSQISMSLWLLDHLFKIWLGKKLFHRLASTEGTAVVGEKIFSLLLYL